MPHVPSAPPGTRFFARLDRFHCECPACGQLLIAHKDATIHREHSAFRTRRATLYNPISSQLTCSRCRRTFGVGLVLWPLRGRGSRHLQPPSDHQPTLRELRALGASAYGIWAAEAIQQGDPVNLAIDAPCICPPGCWRGDCPVHPRLYGGAEGAEEAGAESTQYDPPPAVEPEDEGEG